MSDTEIRTRVYRSELRLRQAEETRRSIIDAAADLFSELGYAGTTLAKIAARAGVSVETVQKNGPKAALIRAAVEVRSFGVEGDRDEAAPFAAQTMLEVNAGSAGVWTALTGAARINAPFGPFFCTVSTETPARAAILARVVPE